MTAYKWLKTQTNIYTFQRFYCHHSWFYTTVILVNISFVNFAKSSLTEQLINLQSITTHTSISDTQFM